MAQENTPEQQLQIAERAPYTSVFDGRQDPSSVPDIMVWLTFFGNYHQTYYADIEVLMTAEDAAALRNGATQWAAIRDQNNAEAVNDLTDLVDSDVDSIDPVAVAKELDRRHKARNARLLDSVNATLASLSGPARLTVNQHIHAQIRSRTKGQSFDELGYAKAYPEQYREDLRFRSLPIEEQKRLFFAEHPELDPANREDRSEGSSGFTVDGRGGPD